MKKKGTSLDEDLIKWKVYWGKRKSEYISKNVFAELVNLPSAKSNEDMADYVFIFTRFYCLLSFKSTSKCENFLFKLKAVFGKIWLEPTFSAVLIKIQFWPVFGKSCRKGLTCLDGCPLFWQFSNFKLRTPKNNSPWCTDKPEFFKIFLLDGKA